MEVNGLKRMFSRSIALFNLRYLFYIGDGDSKSYEEINKLNPYPGHQIKKGECVGHVQKRVDSRLRSIKKDYKKKKLSDGKQGDKQNLADWGRSLYNIIQKSNWSADDFRLAMSAKVKDIYQYQMDESFEQAMEKALLSNQIPIPSMLLAQMIHDDAQTRPMENVTVQKQLNNLKQGNLSPQELFAKIRELEEKGAVKLTERELFMHFTNALNKELYAKIMESEITTFSSALKKANLLWSINQTLKPNNKPNNKSAPEKETDPETMYYCEKHGENKSHATADCRGKKNSRKKKAKKEVHNVEAETAEDLELTKKFNKLRNEINELRSQKNKSNSNSKEGEKGKKKKRTPEEERAYFESKNRADFQDLPTMGEWKQKHDDGKLADDKVCRFCKSSKHLVHECEKLRSYRELLKKYNRIDVVAITVNKEKSLPYFSMDVQGKNKIDQHQFMIDSGAEVSVVPLKFAK